MPKFAHLSDEDLKSVIAFLHSDRPCVQPSEIAKSPSKPSLFVKFLAHVRVVANAHNANIKAAINAIMQQRLLTKPINKI